jgi:integrase
VDHLDLERGGFHLDAAWTKDRKTGFQWLPRTLVGSLKDFAEAGEAKRLYACFYGRKDASNKPPDSPLLYVPSHPARELDKDLKTAGISKNTPSGKIDFHASRTAYINLVLESSNVSVKEAQVLARHATPEMTMNVYGRAREERLSKVVENVAENLNLNRERAPVVHRKAVGAENEQCATSNEKRSCALSNSWWRRRELNPKSHLLAPQTLPIQK